MLVFWYVFFGVVLFAYFVCLFSVCFLFACLLFACLHLLFTVVCLYILYVCAVCVRVQACVCVRVRAERGTVHVVIVTCDRGELVFAVGSCPRCVRVALCSLS